MTWTLPELLFRSADCFSVHRALYDPHTKPVLELTYAELASEVRAFGAGLALAGVQAGDHVALFSDNEPRWLISDLAITGIGAVNVPRGSDTAVNEFDFILSHSGATVAIVQNRKLYEKLAKSAAFNSLKFIILLDDSDKPATEGAPDVIRFSDIRDSGVGKEELFIEAAAAVKPESLATIVYTSGTTGSPKGVMLTHRNLLTQPMLVDLGYTPAPGETQLCILPSWHAYERATEYYGLCHGTTLTYSDKKYIREDLLKLCPHLLPCVPRIWESVYKAIHSKLSAAPERRQKIFKLFTNAGFRFIKARRLAYMKYPSQTKIPAWKSAIARAEMAALYPVYELGDKLVFSKIRQITGGRLRAAVSGGGSLAPYLDDFFEVVGIPILNGYGLTETSPVITVRTVDHNVRGTVGRPMAETEVTIRSETGEVLSNGQTGEIWVKGPQIMSGYYNNQDATDKVLKSDGWFVTGDLGWLTHDGDLVITGRAKDTIVLSSGENVEPEPIEDACRKSPLIQQIMLVGQDQKTLGALVVPDFQNLAEAMGIPADTEPMDITKHKEAPKVLKQNLNQLMNAAGNFKAAESISRVHILIEPFSEANGLMTNTLKVKRNVVLERYKAEIAAMYD